MIILAIKLSSFKFYQSKLPLLLEIHHTTHSRHPLLPPNPFFNFLITQPQLFIRSFIHPPPPPQKSFHPISIPNASSSLARARARTNTRGKMGLRRCRKSDGEPPPSPSNAPRASLFSRAEAGVDEFSLSSFFLPGLIVWVQWHSSGYE